VQGRIGHLGSQAQGEADRWGDQAEAEIEHQHDAEVQAIDAELLGQRVKNGYEKILVFMNLG